MRSIKSLCLTLLLFAAIPAFAQRPLIHAHNDYEQPEPFVNAWRNKVFCIEANIYPGDSLYVAHDKKDISAGKTLVGIYLQPIIDLFIKYQGRISDDTAYAPVLMIDIKEHSDEAIPQLIKWLSAYPAVFDRSVNALAVQVVITGERGVQLRWSQWPSYLLFDGRPYESYDSSSLQRVAFVSDSYINYAKGTNNTDTTIQMLAAKVHAWGKLLRLWATPDNEASWSKLQHLGVDIINTDNVTECSNYFFKDANEH